MARLDQDQDVCSISAILLDALSNPTFFEKRGGWVSGCIDLIEHCFSISPPLAWEQSWKEKRPDPG